MRRVVVVDDHTVFAEVLALALEREGDFQCVGHAQGVETGLAMVDALRPEIVVMDVRLADGDGIAATAELVERHPELRVVILTGEVDHTLLRRAAAAKASALALKDGELGDILAILRTVDRGGFAVAPRLLGRLVGGTEVPEQRVPPLTARERDVLRMLAAGLDARQIAQEMGISVHTCRGYVKSLLQKLGAHSQLEAVATAMRHGLLGDRHQL